MKTLRYILLCIFILAVSSCQEEEYGPSVFEITGQTYGTELFAYGAEKQFALTSENIKVNYVKCIKGWTGELVSDVLTITAPQKDTEEYQQSGKIGLYARGYDEVEYVLWIEVEVTDDAKEGQPAGFMASFEDNILNSGFWKAQDRFRVYDEYDSDGFEFEPSTEIPESGVEEMLFNGILSENSQKVFAAYPADVSLVCSANGNLSGLSLPQMQCAVIDGYDQSYNEAVAAAQDGKLVFMSPYSWLKVTLADNMVKSITVTDTDGDCALAGKYVYDITEMKPQVTEGISSVVLLPAEGENNFAAGTYYLTVLPQTLSGIKVAYETSEGEMREEIIDEAVELKRNTVFDLGRIKVSAGTGVEDDPYLLRTVADLQAMSGKLTPGAIVYFELVKDIDLTGVEWTPVSDGTATIHFDGSGKTISNLTCSTGKASFFGKLSGSCSNVSFVNASITGTSDICGIFAGEAEAVISDVYVSGTVTSGVRRTGGLVGYLTGGSLSGCWAKVSVSNTSGVSVGGLVGAVDASEPVSISNCQLLAESSVVGTGEYVGGIVGYFTNGDISNCSVTEATVTGKSGHVGGIVGYSKGNIEGCISMSSTIACDSGKDYAGGIVGNSSGVAKISMCAVKQGSVTSRRMAGGIVGCANESLTIENSYSHNCAITATERRAGGILGVGAVTSDKVIRVYRCYTTASVTALYTAGGITGYDSTRNGKNIYSQCVAWNSKIEQTSDTQTYSSGAIVGYCGTTYTLSDCLRKYNLNFIVPDALTASRPVDQENCDGTTTLLTEGTYADDGYGWKYLYPYHGKATTLTTVSAVAKSLSWDENVWDLTGDYPKLK